MLGAKARLGVLVGVLVGLGVAVAIGAPVSRQGLRALIDPLGWAGPPVYVVLSAGLGALFVPGPLLAGAAGLLFGTWGGFAVTVVASVLGAVVSLLLARHGGRAGVEELENPRVRRVEALLQRHGLAAVVVQRLAPAIPDAPCSYLFGLAGLGVLPVALGTLIGAAPRGLSYSALGSAAGSQDATQAVIAVVGIVLTGVLGAVLAAVAYRRQAAARD